jgi:hypothetical protein
VDKLSSQDAPILATALRNDGFIEDGDRQRVPTRGAVFLLIATARAKETRALAGSCRSDAERTAKLKAALEGAVPADLLERVDAVVHLGVPDAITLAALVVERLEAAADAKGVRLCEPAVPGPMLAALARIAEDAMADGLPLGSALDRFAAWADRALSGAARGDTVRIDGDDPVDPVLTIISKGRPGR